jgi:hypothetical protein
VQRGVDGDEHHVRFAYQSTVSSTFLSEQTSHQQPASSTFLSEKTSTSHQPPAKRAGWRPASTQQVHAGLVTGTRRHDVDGGSPGVIVNTYNATNPPFRSKKLGTCTTLYRQVSGSCAKAHGIGELPPVAGLTREMAPPGV